VETFNFDSDTDEEMDDENNLSKEVEMQSLNTTNE